MGAVQEAVEQRVGDSGIITEEEKRAARQEADVYESLSEEERGASWKEFPESIEADGDIENQMAVKPG
jgi:hypothetical protein